MIRGLTFDVGGTLADGELNRESFQAELLEYLRNLGFEVSPERYRRVMSSALRRLRETREKFLEIKFEEFYSGALDGLRVPPRPEILEGVRRIYGRNFPQVPKTRVRETLRELRETYVLGVVSNSMTGVPRDFLEREGLASYFDAVILSRDVGFRKPDPKIFSIALRKLGLRPSEGVHIGNSFGEDVVGAKRAGMKTVLVGEEERWGEVGPDLTIRSIIELPSALRRISEL